MQTSKQNSVTQCWCIFCCKVLRFQCVYNPLQSSGRLDNLQRPRTARVGMRAAWMRRTCGDMTLTDTGDHLLLQPSQPLHHGVRARVFPLQSIGYVGKPQETNKARAGLNQAVERVEATHFGKADCFLLLRFLWPRLVQTLKLTPSHSLNSSIAF